VTDTNQNATGVAEQV